MRSSVCTMKILLLIVLLSPVLAVNALKPGYTPDEWMKSNGRLHGLRKPNGKQIKFNLVFLLRRIL